MDRSERFISSFLAVFFSTLGVLMLVGIAGSILFPDAGSSIPDWIGVPILLGLPVFWFVWACLRSKRSERTRLLGKHTASRLARMVTKLPATRTRPRF